MENDDPIHLMKHTPNPWLSAAAASGITSVILLVYLSGIGLALRSAGVLPCAGVELSFGCNGRLGLVVGAYLGGAFLIPLFLGSHLLRRRGIMHATKIQLIAVVAASVLSLVLGPVLNAVLNLVAWELGIDFLTFRSPAFLWVSMFWLCSTVLVHAWAGPRTRLDSSEQSTPVRSRLREPVGRSRWDG